MALYKVQSPINSALQGMQNASATTAGMTKKQEVKEPKKSFGGALGSMIAGGSYGLGMADMFTGSEATKAMWGGVKGALGGGAAETGAATTAATEAVNALAPVTTAAGSTAIPAGVASADLGSMGTIAGGSEALASAGSALEGVAGGALASTAPKRPVPPPPPVLWDGDFWRPELWPGSQATCCKEVP